ncbi:laccase 7 [Tanacetum coccineum]|uniref:Laccase n=1 Tax=Tanacetum coccineum TaxID=301880 RepID=A0ABQ5CK54_9ASTR
MRAGSSRMASDININLYNSLFEDATKRQRTSAPTSELGQYMATNFLITLRPEDFTNFDILAWWKEREIQFPILSAMARDLLTVQASTVASESTFSISVDRVQHETSLEGPILEDVEETIAREEVDLRISPPNTELDEASADTVETSFDVQNLTVNRLCQNIVITAVNGSLPGPTITAKEGDTVIAHVFNRSPYNLTIHWHGVFQRLTPWADGPVFITQCPIRPGGNYTYMFNLTGQEGTLWWHAHVQWLRATVYGALVILPRDGQNYPFVNPYLEDTILLGEWWNANVIDVENTALASGAAPVDADAYTFNGWPGDLFNTCVSTNTYRLNVEPGRTYLLRIINAALNTQFFFKIANHSMTVVGADAAYTNPYQTDVLVLGPGQTHDVLMTANQSPGLYYMTASPYATAAGVTFNGNTTSGIIAYQNSTQTTPPILPVIPASNDTVTAFAFSSNLTSLVTSRFWSPVPLTVDENMFITMGLGLSPCNSTTNCTGIFGQRLSASMNNRSFVLPSQVSLLEAVFRNISGVYTTDFPDTPPLIFDYTNANNSFDQSGLLFAPKLTSVRRFKYNATVQVVFQNTALIGVENHPMHLHGFNFYVLAQGFGNYNSTTDTQKFNLVNPQERNTIGVPVGGWAVIRFRADNPGAWYTHCHLDVHLSWGLGMVLLVDNGGTPESTLPPPPADLPQC